MIFERYVRDREDYEKKLVVKASKNRIGQQRLDEQEVSGVLYNVVGYPITVYVNPLCLHHVFIFMFLSHKNELPATRASLNGEATLHRTFPY